MLTTSGVILAGSAAQVKVATNLTYAKAFSAGTSTKLTLNASRHFTLTGSASFLRDNVDGPGRLTINGTSLVNLVTLGGMASWYNAGTLTETGTLTIGDAAGNAPTFVKKAKGVFNLDGTVGIAIGKSTTSKFTNQGLLEKKAGGVSVVSIGIVNTGTISGYLTLLAIDAIPIHGFTRDRTWIEVRSLLRVAATEGSDRSTS